MLVKICILFWFCCNWVPSNSLFSNNEIMNYNQYVTNCTDCGWRGREPAARVWRAGDLAHKPGEEAQHPTTHEDHLQEVLRRLHRWPHDLYHIHLMDICSPYRFLDIWRKDVTSFLTFDVKMSLFLTFNVKMWLLSWHLMLRCLLSSTFDMKMSPFFDVWLKDVCILDFNHVCILNINQVDFLST